MRKEEARLAPNNRGFTLIEIMVVVVILGILAGLVVPRLLEKPDEARRTKAVLQIEQVKNALEMFKLNNGFYPSTEQGLKALVTKPETGMIPKKYQKNGYLPKVPNDPWGNSFIYLSPGSHGPYDLISYGADAESGGEGNDADIESWNLE